MGHLSQGLKFHSQSGNFETNSMDPWMLRVNAPITLRHQIVQGTVQKVLQTISLLLRRFGIHSFAARL